MFQLKMHSSKKLTESRVSRPSHHPHDLLAPRQLLTKTCKLYLNKYQEIKRDIQTQSQYIQSIKNKKHKLQQKSRAPEGDRKYVEYKAEMVNNKENIEEFLNVYKQEHGEELGLLQEKEELEIRLTQLQDRERVLKRKREKVEEEIKQDKERMGFRMKLAKYQEMLKEVKLQLIEKELEINQYCGSKKNKNLRYYICQFGKEYGLAMTDDLFICSSMKVSLFASYIKNQPIYINLKKDISEFLELYQQLEEIMQKKPQLSSLVESLENEELALLSQLKEVQGDMANTQQQITKKAKEIQDLGNKQIKLNLKTILQHNPEGVIKEAKLVAVQQRKRVNSVKEKLGEIRYISDCLKNIKSVERTQKSRADERDSLSKIIGVEESKLRNQITAKDQIEECLDNIISDRHVFGDKPLRKSKRMSMIDLHQQSMKPEPTFRENTYLLKGSSSQHLLPHFGLQSQLTTALNSDNISRQSRLVSLSQTQRRLPITHSLNKKTMQDLLMSRIAKKTLKL